MSDQLRPYAAIVNNGSGCIFQPAADDYTYILTANHNITKAQNAIKLLQRFEFDGNAWNVRDIPFLPLVVGQNYFPHEQYDIAILKVDRLSGFDNIYRTDEIETGPVYSLIGYPEGRREARPHDSSEWFRYDSNISILGTNKGAREAHIPWNPGKLEVDGQSGGPVLRERNGKILLVGIEYGMVPAKTEQLGRVNFFPMSAFDEIIKAYPEKLSTMVPSFMRCFSFLMEEIFELDAGFSNNNITGVKGYLLYKAKEISGNDCTPFAIKEYFNKRLLIDQQPEEVLASKAIWQVWLEFLTFMVILNKATPQMANVKELFDSVRLLFSGSPKDWSSELINMVYSDYKGLADKGTVVVAMSTPPKDGVYVINKSIPSITDARNIRDRDRILINKGLSFPFDHFKFVHIDYFKGGTIVNKHADWAELTTDEEYLEKLRKEYERLFTT